MALRRLKHVYVGPGLPLPAQLRPWASLCKAHIQLDGNVALLASELEA